MEKVVITKIEKNTTDTISIFFNKPNPSFDFKSGQYITILVNIDDVEHRRAYSIASDPQAEVMAFTVKRVDRGIVSNYIHDHFKEGQEIQLVKPQGRFICKTDESLRRQHVFIAGGSGITPIMSMIYNVLENEPKSNVILLYGNKTQEDVIFKEKLDQLERHHQGQFKVIHFLSRIDVFPLSWNGRVGRINPENFAEALEDNLNPKIESIYYLCGPGNMIDTLKSYLLDQSVAKSNIRQEYFIGKTDIPNNKSEAKVKDGFSKIEVVLEGTDYIIEQAQSETILDSLIEKDIEAPYSCMSGSCSSCVAQLDSGTVEMEQCYALDQDEIDAGLILTCQAKPTSTSVSISYDID